MLATAALVGAALAVPSAHAAMAAAVGVYRPEVGKFFLDGNYDHVADFRGQLGLPGDTGLLCDIAGSGARSPATFRDGVWKFDFDRDSVADMTITFGQPGDVAICADMDVPPDGRDDLVIYRDGTWLVALNPLCAAPATSCTRTATATYTFGIAGDVPLVADMDGNGAQDLILYRNGNWFVSTTRANPGTLGYTFGLPTDIPMAFDYDGDGSVDLVLFRKGLWYVTTTRANPATDSFGFGGVGDKPLYFGPGAKSSIVLDAARLLYQGSFGPTPADIARVQTLGIAGWVDDQLNNQPKTNLPVLPGWVGAPPTAPGWWPQNPPQPASMPACVAPSYAGPNCQCNDVGGTANQCQRDNYSIYQLQRAFWRDALSAPDQLRMRVAWALSQILVTSAQQDTIQYANRDYQQLLRDFAFARFEDLLFAISVNSFMGNYLDMANNRKATATTSPNENYAREIMQLFSIGLFELNPDGSILGDSNGEPIATYSQTEITELAKVFTGWTYFPRPGVANAAWNAPVNYTNTMIPCESAAINGCGGNTNFHETASKTFLGVTVPAGLRADPDLRSAVTTIASHPNVGPFIGRQLIQHLVTSNPSPAYVKRVTQVWNNDGTGVRGNLKAVVRAILLDAEARAPRNPVFSTFGVYKEPVLFVTNFLRSVGATGGPAASGYTPNDAVYLLNTRVTNMGEDPFNSPTVFNFYPADYVAPGTNLAGPQFGILDATTYFSRVNFIYNMMNFGQANGCTPAPSTNVNLGNCAPNSTVLGATGTKVDLSIAAGMYNNPAALVDFVASVMIYEPLPPAWRTQIINAVSAITLSATPTDVQKYDRARTAYYLIAISPKYQTEH